MPDNWSETWASLGMVGTSFNSNLEPLGKRGEGGWGVIKRKVEEEEPSMFDKEDWAGWQPPSKKQVMGGVQLQLQEWGQGRAGYG